MPKVGWQIAERLREIDNTISDIRVMLSHVEKQLAHQPRYLELSGMTFRTIQAIRATGGVTQTKTWWDC